jgi:predicted enzyme related to lactoylglutathione lyase
MDEDKAGNWPCALGNGQRAGQSPFARSDGDIDLVELRGVEAAGGKALMPKMPIPGIGWFAVCSDTEGNKFGIMEEDPKAK